MKLYEKICNIQGRLSLPTQAKWGLRVWTRGDGARYKSASTLCRDSDRASIPSLWNEIVDMFPDAKHLEVRDEFGCDPYHSAIVADGMVLINRELHIQFGSQSILRNTEVWKTR